MTNSTAHPGGGIPNTTLTGSATLSNGSTSRPDFADYDCHSSAPVLLAVVGGYSAVGLVGLLGNLCLIGVIWRQKETQNVTNLLIGNLAASDTLVCVICIPFTVVYTLMDHWPFGEAMCKVTSFVQCLSVSVSSFSLVLIAVERYQLIVNPRGWKPNVTHAHWSIAGIWLGSAALSLPYLVFYHLSDEPFLNISHSFYRDKYACMDGWPSERSRLGFNTCLLLVQYVAPLCFILVCYGRVLACLRRRGERGERQRESEARVSETKRINSLLVSIVAAFAACWLPLNIFNLLFDWHHETLLSCHHNLLFTLCHMVAMVSTCINPVFYGFLNKNFQKDLQMRLCGFCSSPEAYNNVGMSVMQTDISKGSLRLNNSTSAC
ncbi:neuropeptide Y receptor type 6-like [Anguilla anguilla]|uniref:neuropeptide Y receptor type 6-like n=1 Tax=Anguilla anguilla TaxID=7936 RepID=UPI0015A95CD2|nr:neuropeptide Y receptor type 6-like [Anguilla anguilla]XP_035263654.1 neuropeptide Y receptor type 6-like [Anguilla anguilla]